MTGIFKSFPVDESVCVGVQVFHLEESRYWKYVQKKTKRWGTKYLLLALVLVFSWQLNMVISSRVISEKMHINIQNRSILVSFDVRSLKGAIIGYHPATLTLEAGIMCMFLQVPISIYFLCSGQYCDQTDGVTATCFHCGHFLHGIFQTSGITLGSQNIKSVAWAGIAMVFAAWGIYLPPFSSK